MSEGNSVNSNTLDSKVETLYEKDWSFPESDTSYLTHGLFTYPARMIPRIPDEIFRYYFETGELSKGDTVYDPFAGSGTTGVEARRHSLNTILMDINPLAQLLSRVKCTVFDPTKVQDAWVDLVTQEVDPWPAGLGQAFNQIETYYDRNIELDITRPDVSTDFEWFPNPQLYQLAHLRDRIELVGSNYDTKICDFFRVILSETSRIVSYQRNGEFKRYRIPEKERESYDPDVLKVFKRGYEEKLPLISDYAKEADPDVTTRVLDSDARIPKEIKTNSVDFVMTSPPYGDHETTVAYGQFSRDPAVISMQEDMEIMKSVDRIGLGGKETPIPPLESLVKKSPALENTVSKLEEKNGRVDDAIGFFTDYYECIKQIKRILKPGKLAVIVAANRHISRVNIPTHQITLELFEYLNFDTEHVLPRDIPTKTLPYENSPENVVGKTGKMMADEFVLIIRAP